MDIQAEKLELIKLITDENSESVLKKIKNLLQPKDKSSEVESPAMIKRLEESRKQYEEGKAVSFPTADLAKIATHSFDDIWNNPSDEQWNDYLNNKAIYV